MNDIRTDGSESPPPGSSGAPLSFGCDDCSLQRSDHCADCVVTYLCAQDRGAVVVTIDDLRVVRRLQDGGLAPPLRYRRDSSAAS